MIDRIGNALVGLVVGGVIGTLIDVYIDYTFDWRIGAAGAGICAVMGFVFKESFFEYLKERFLGL